MIVCRYSYSTDGQKLIVEKGRKEGLSVYVPRRYPNKTAPIKVRYNVALYEGEIKNNALWLEKRDDEKAINAFTEYYKKKIEKLDKEKDGYLRRIKLIAKEGVILRDGGSCE